MINIYVIIFFCIQTPTKFYRSSVIQSYLRTDVLKIGVRKMQNSVEFLENGRELTAILAGEIDHHLAKEQREAIDRMLFQKKPRLLVLDFSAVKFMDSSGIGLIIGRVDIAEGLNCKISVKGLSRILRKLVKLSGVEKLKNLTIED